MGWFDSETEVAQAHDEYHAAPHKAKLSHEVLAGAAAYEAAKAYEDHLAKNGKPTSHAKAKAVFAALVAAVIDREVETKGLDYLDKEKAKHAAQQHAEEIIVTEYRT